MTCNESDNTNSQISLYSFLYKHYAFERNEIPGTKRILGVSAVLHAN